MRLPCREEPVSMQNRRIKKGAAPDVKSSNSFFSQDIINQLNTVFAKMERKLQLELHLDSRPVSQELENYMTELAKYTDKLTVHERVPFCRDRCFASFCGCINRKRRADRAGFSRRPWRA